MIVPLFEGTVTLILLSVDILSECLEPLTTGRNLACETVGPLAGISHYNNTQNDTARSIEYCTCMYIC